MSDETIYKIALSFLPRIGPISIRKLLLVEPDIQKLFQFSSANPLEAPGIISWYLTKKDQETILKRAVAELKRMKQYNINLSHFRDEDYPPLLNQFPDAPINLFWMGSQLPGIQPGIAIVGTRKPSSRGISQVQYLIQKLKNRGIQFISGLAYGIDIAMHQHCITEEQVNFAILGHGLHTVYPSVHRSTARQIIDRGALMTEYPLDTKPDRQHFPQRNRIIAGLADVLVVVESKEQGGSMITADLANQYNKDVFAFPGRIDDDTSKGCNLLIKKHQAHLLQSVADIEYISGWSLSEQQTAKQQNLFENLSESEQKILTLFRKSKTIHIDRIQSESGFHHSKLSSELLSLEFKGIIRPLPGKFFTILKVQ